MGRRNQYVDADLTFAPKISETSKRIALAGGKRHSIESNGIPHFMLKTKCTLNSREPLGPIPVSDSSLLKEQRRNNPSDDTASKSPVNTGVIAERNRPTTAIITLSLPAFGQSGTVCTDEENANFVNNCNSFISNQMLVKRNNLFESDSEKNNSISTKNNSDPDLDSSVFTFKPCISTASIKIAETLNSDFMSRQQQHIENQKKHIERADIQFKKSLNLSPRSKRYPSRIYKDNENTNEVNNREEKGDNSASSTPPPKNEVTSDDNNDNNNLEITESFDDIAEMPAAGPLTVNRMKTSTSANLQRLLDGPYANEVLKNQKTRFSNPGVIPRPVPNGDNLSRDKENDAPGGFTQSRSKTMPSLTRPKVGRKLSQVAEGDRLRLAKETVEKAIKYRKIFTIQGGYASIRQSLRKRGWVEKFYKTTNTVKRQSRPKRRKQNSESDDDDDDGDNNDDDDDDDDGTDDGTDDDNDEPKIPPWEEDDGLYGIMSRMVRNVNPQFFWVLKRDVIDYRFLLREQMVNHYCKAGSFTTKVGLCVNLRNVRLFDNADPDAFCPRCYRLSHEEDKEAFIDDYRLSACMNIVKLVHDLGNKSNTEINESTSSTDKCVSSVSNDMEKISSSTVKETELNKDIENKSAKESSKESEESSTEEVKTSCKDPKCAEVTKDGTKCVHLKEDEAIKVQEEKKKEEDKKMDELKKVTIISPRLSQKTIPAQSKNSPRTSKKKKKKAAVPLKALEQAIGQCELFLRFKQHEDIDHLEEKDVLSDDQWDQQLQWYYSLAHDDGVIQSIPQAFLEKCENLMSRLRSKCPQFDLDGIRNVWIVKPGAKSRGRGIVCYDKLEDMLKLVNSQVVRKDSKYVVQKYIERPLLVYNTKFDIRQWFLVTDWNPLTIWFYQDSYLRFCSQQYTLDDFDESIHLSNNAIQKHYKNGPRSSSLPSDNMWTHEQFKDYLRSKKQDGLWEEMIYPGMKKAIQCALLTAQDLIEYRKSSFELYGADFMLTEDYRPWLIEINSSPSMEASTAVTARMCNSVLDDTIKVVIDRKHDRNCDIGRFELAFKQPLVSVPPYIGINLQVDGQAIKKPIGFKKSEIFVPQDTISPNNSNSNVASDKSADSKSVSSNSNTRVSSDNSNKKTVNSDNKAKKSPVQGATIKSSNSGTSSIKPATKVPGTVPVDVSCGTADNKLQASISDTGINRSQYYNSSDLSATKVIKSGGSNRQPEPPSHPKVCMQTPFASVGNRRIVSKTSVSVNYNIPGALSEKPTKATAVSVKNVESTDFTNVKSKSKGLTQLIPTMWCRMCSECGYGTNLHFHAVNPNCKCRRERMLDYLINSRPQSASPKPCNSQGTVGKSRPPSAASTIRNIKHKYSNTHTNPKMTKMDNILLRYTDTCSRRHSQITSVNKAPLPHVVGYFIRGTCPRKPIEKTTVYLDTSKYTNPFYIRTHKSNFQ